MKQITTMCDRFFEGKPSLAKKWRANFIVNHGKATLLYTHYQHIIAIYDLESEKFIGTYYEKDADKRGLDDILEYHKMNPDKIKYFKKNFIEDMKSKWVNLFGES